MTKQSVYRFAMLLLVIPLFLAGCASSLSPVARERLEESRARVLSGVSGRDAWETGDSRERVEILWQYALEQDRIAEYENASTAIEEMIRIDKELEGDPVLVVKLIEIHNNSVDKLLNE